MNTRILIAVVVSMFVCQQVYARDEEPVMPEATELEGTWEVVSSVPDGEQLDTATGRQWRFEGNRDYCRGSEDKTWMPVGTFSMDPSAMPAEIDFVRKRRCGVLGQLGIYELDGDLLRICFSSNFRPDRFESTEDNPTILIVFRRVEENDE